MTFYQGLKEGRDMILRLKLTYCVVVFYCVLLTDATVLMEHPSSCTNKVSPLIAALQTSYCGFEDPHLCGYQNLYYSDLDWKQWSGPTPGTYTGPTCDHTCQNRRGEHGLLAAALFV